MHLALASRDLALDAPLILGIVNVTPDSFSDGGRFFGVREAADHASRLLEEGADVLDIGGESTRPQGATPVDAAEERKRILPVIAELRRRHPDCCISVDTVKSDVAEAALAEGTEIINDVSGFRLDPRMADVVAAARAGAILMHSRGTVSSMATYEHATYGSDVTGEVVGELEERVAAAVQAGVRPESIALDPGFGFAKRTEQSLRVLAELDRLVAVGLPVAVGVSRKRFVGELSGVERPADRLEGSIAANVMALAAGARIFRVHDVRPTRRALDVAWAIVRSRRET